MNRTARVALISLLVLLLVPLLIVIGMMMMMFGGGVMPQMGGMHLSAGLMALCGLWALLVVAVLIALIVVLTRGAGSRGNRGAPPADLRSPLHH